jgi:hypothetical protein
MNQKRILVSGDSNSWGFVPCGPDVVGLARLVEECKGGVNTVYPSPKVLLLAPPPLGTGFHNPEEWAGGPEKSQVLGSVLKEGAAAAGLPFSRCRRTPTTLRV